MANNGSGFSFDPDQTMNELIEELMHHQDDEGNAAAICELNDDWEMEITIRRREKFDA